MWLSIGLGSKPSHRAGDARHADQFQLPRVYYAAPRSKSNDIHVTSLAVGGPYQSRKPDDKTAMFGRNLLEPRYGERSGAINQFTVRPQSTSKQNGIA